LADQAGFDHDGIVTATALAIATSGGIDDYDYRPGLPGCGHYVGLWGVDTDRWPWLADRPLHDPRVAATAAYELWRDHDGWSWSPAWAAGHWQHYTQHAATEMTRTYAAQRAEVPYTFPASERRYHETIERVRAGRRLGH
jgi:hypothetical protein